MAIKYSNKLLGKKKQFKWVLLHIRYEHDLYFVNMQEASILLIAFVLYNHLQYLF